VIFSLFFKIRRGQRTQWQALASPLMQNIVHACFACFAASVYDPGQVALSSHFVIYDEDRPDALLCGCQHEDEKLQRVTGIRRNNLVVAIVICW
jgi:hypothetical protein